jgi:3-hydroxyisobutyrate dehydrogenase-like beta-hydroxyacid dehydrogenase
MARGLTPDKALEISLIGTCERLHHEGLTPAQIVAELKTIANGRADLLARAAAHHLGTWLAHPGMTHPAKVTMAGYLVMAGADPSDIAAMVDQVRKNAGGSSYSL